MEAVAANRDATTMASFKLDFEFNFMEGSERLKEKDKE
jgi:hypothetical protein